MERRRISVMAAGLSQPSSTRLLADRLTEATVGALDGVDVEVTVVELRDLGRDRSQSVRDPFALPDGFSPVGAFGAQ